MSPMSRSRARRNWRKEETDDLSALYRELDAVDDRLMKIEELVVKAKNYGQVALILLVVAMNYGREVALDILTRLLGVH